MTAPPSARAARLAWLVPVLGCAALVGVLLAADRAPTADGPHLAGAELRLAQLLREGELGLAWKLFVTLISPQPLGGYVPGILAFLVLGGGRLAPLVVMSGMLLLAWDAYRRLAGGDALRGGGWAAWLLLVASPMTWLYVNQYGRDVVAAAAVLQTVSWLHASDGLRDRRASAWFGAWMALSLLTKYTAPFFLWLPCLAAGLGLVVGSARRREGARAAWINLGVAVAACLAIAGPWWLAYGSRVVQYLAASANSAADIGNLRSAAEIHSLAGRAYYPLALKDALGWPPLVLALVGFALPRGPRLAALAALGGVVVLSTLSAAQDRYAMPAVFALAAGLLPFARAMPLNRRAIVGIAAVLTVTLPLLYGSALTHRPGAPVSSGSFVHPLETAAALSWPVSPAYPPERFDADAWDLARAVAEVAAVQGSSTGTIGLLLSRSPYAPQFAQILQVAGEAGKRWDYATINILYDPSGARGQPEPWFIGPLFDGAAWPPRTFTTLLTVVPPEPEANLTNWMTTNRGRLTEVTRWNLPNGGSGAVYRYSARQAGSAHDIP